MWFTGESKFIINVGSNHQATVSGENLNTTSLTHSYLHQVFSGEKRQANMFHQVSQVFLPDIFIMVNPSYHRLKNLHHKVHRHSSHQVQSFGRVVLPEYGEQGECVRTFSSVGMVSLSLAIKLDTCSMPRLRNSSLPTTSVKCCSGNKKKKKNYFVTADEFSQH